MENNFIADLLRSLMTGGGAFGPQAGNRPVAPATPALNGNAMQNIGGMMETARNIPYTPGPRQSTNVEDRRLTGDAYKQNLHTLLDKAVDTGDQFAIDELLKMLGNGSKLAGG